MEERQEVVRELWESSDATEAVAELEQAAPPKVCKRMRGVTFDAMFEGSREDLGAAWRDLLQREGKYDGTGESIRDLVLGRDRE
ncbi:hypothetical protein [Nocardioides mangrovi]|uniref:Addiction module protein n=1 Tax=Nocardioides mangrovi TaxID=2874580 RepID=A0ABS7UEK5_9ACTN|nr:hypothetical protein [Nocardioides mangrovi]MBZ5739436.1 hypothetical protein [Nocardioides mangrovi]